MHETNRYLCHRDLRHHLPYDAYHHFHRTSETRAHPQGRENNSDTATQATHAEHAQTRRRWFAARGSAADAFRFLEPGADSEPQHRHSGAIAPAHAHSSTMRYILIFSKRFCAQRPCERSRRDRHRPQRITQPHTPQSATTAHSTATAPHHELQQSHVLGAARWRESRAISAHGAAHSTKPRTNGSKAKPRRRQRSAAVDHFSTQKRVTRC
jgi:hypothetical protein